MPQRARPDLCGGRWATSVPTAMSARLTGAVQPVKVRREGEGKPPLPPRVMGRHPRGWRLSVDRGTCGQGH